ncbi:MAG: hypothetical protein H0X16_11325, partial [Chloroflexi bacterium]|nr:hypothetical protein [Chloroflexota bacterium]
MHLLDGQPVFSATDLVGFLACDHLTQLERAAVSGERPGGRPHRDDPVLDTIRQRGFEHEQRFLDGLKAEGRQVTEISPDASADAPDGSRESHGDQLRRQARETREAINRGDDVIYQAAFFDGRWRGHADFLLRRNDKASLLGPYSYEIADTKLAHKTKASAILQICSYIEQLTQIQGVEPDEMLVALGGKARAIERHRVADFMAYYRTVKTRFERAVDGEIVGPPAYPSLITVPEPVEHCGVCRWLFEDCQPRWRREDALNLVAGITTRQRTGLRTIETDTRRKLAVLPLPPPKIERTSRDGIVRVREQARLQVQGEDESKRRGEEVVLYDLLDPRVRRTGPADDSAVIRDRDGAADNKRAGNGGAVDDKTVIMGGNGMAGGGPAEGEPAGGGPAGDEGVRAALADGGPTAPEANEVDPERGLSILPPPSPGDLFFDIEGDPFAEDEGLEYLFGVVEPGPELIAPPLTLGLAGDGQASGAPEATPEPQDHAWWAFTREEEKRAFEQFIDFVMARLQRDPKLHIYHYASYERGRMGRLSTRHGTREEEVDRLLRGGVFVDLFRAVRQGVRV